MKESNWRTVALVTATSMMLSIVVAEIGAHIMGAPTTWQHYVFATVVPALITPMWAGPLIRLNRKLVEAQAELYRLAHSDQLSGLPNRRAFFQGAREMFASGRDTIAVMMIDIDSFKSINDQYGHDMGDAAIKAIAATIWTAVERAGRGPQAISARVGGDEFAVAAVDVTPDEATALADGICAAVRMLAIAVPPDGARQLCPTVSVGVAMRFEGQNVDETLKMADVAAFEAKARGRNCWHFNGPPRVEPAASARASSNLALPGRLRTV